MSAAEKLKLTPAAYLERERAAPERSEYVDGEVFAMAGGTFKHSLIAANLIREISERLKDRPCVVLGSDMKVWIEAANTFAYPDLSGRCGPLDFYDERQDVYANPEFIVEILSPGTESYDRGGKFLRYQTLASLREYVLVSQETATVEIYRRHEAGWLYESMQNLNAVLRLDSVDCSVPLAEIYRGVLG
jgi:Uma2 family endonuclease